MINHLVFILNIILISCLGFAFIVGFYRLIQILLGFFKLKHFPETNKQARFAIIIPARQESNVIARVLKSIKYQVYDPSKIDVYVVCEEKDETFDIVNSFGYTCFIRSPNEPKGKGNAMDSTIKMILNKGLKYDAYITVDADNFLMPHFVMEMNKAFQSGIKLGMGYRNTINKPGKWIADCSALSFSSINTFQNKARTKFGSSIMVSGTGFFIDAKIINNFGGWPFNTLTEDYQLSLWCCLNDIKSAYIPTAEFYDEQPTNLQILNKQRVRWIRGFFQTRRLYRTQMLKSIVGKSTNKFSKFDFCFCTIPNAIFLFSVFAYILTLLGIVVFGLIATNIPLTSLFLPLQCMGFAILGFYFILVLYTILQLLAESRKMKFGFFNSIKIALLNPFFICLYIPHALQALFKKEVKWAKIEHGIAKEKF